MKTTRFGVRLEPTLLQIVAEQAAKERCSISQLIRQALLAYVVRAKK